MNMKIFLSATILFIFILPLAGSSQNKSNELPDSNPFKYASTLPYHAPAFNKIKDADYKPAMEAGIQEQLAEIKAIANNPQPPNFENTMVAMEKCGDLLRRVSAVFSMVAGANAIACRAGRPRWLLKYHSLH